MFGIDIELHLFFILFILAFILLSPPVALLLIIIFFFVTLHELTHSIVAIKNNIKVRKIVLLPIGGMAMMEGADIKPITEIKMSLAGPLLNLIIVYICLFIGYVFSLPLGTWLVQFMDPSQAFSLSIPELVLFYSFYANLILGLFNLFLPAFPLDGGRVFRALLALKLDYVRASRIAKNVSLVIAVLMFLAAFIYGELWIMIISFFIAFGAVAEFESMIVHRALGDVKVRDIVAKNFLSVSPAESVSSVAAKMLERRRMDALVMTKGAVKVVSLSDISRLDRESWKKKAGTIAKRVPSVSLGSGVETAVKIMEQSQTALVPVFEGKKLVGVVDRLDVERILKIIGMMKAK